MEGTPNSHQGVTTAGNKDIILMPSALITVKDNNTSVRARALFDTGSHRTFITEKLSKILHLKPVSREILNGTTFGSKQSEKTEYKVVSLVLLAKSEHINVRALVSPTICPPIRAKARHRIQDYPEFNIRA